MLELAGQGSRVLHLRSVEFAAKYNVPLRVLSSFRPGPGTLICKEEHHVEAPLISGIAFNRDEAQITISGLPDTADCVARVLKPISAANIEVDMIVLATGRDGLKDLSFTVHRDDFLEAQRLARNITAEFPGCAHDRRRHGREARSGRSWNAFSTPEWPRNSLNRLRAKA